MHYRRVLRSGEPGPPGELRTRGVCALDGCEEPHDAAGLCHGHYQRLLRTGSVGEDPLRRSGRLCSVAGCGRPHKARGYCAAHYKRVLEHGHPRADEPIRKARGEGTIGQDGYKYVPVPGDLRPLTNGSAWIGEHRLVMALHLRRPLLPDEQVHHINGERADNRLGNLELWSTSHPSGSRVEDLLEWCEMILDRYGDEFDLWLAEGSS